MKKKFFAVALAATMVLGCASSAMAATDIETGLVAHYSFEDSLANEAGADGATATMGKGTAAYATGIKGKAFDFTANKGTVSVDGIADNAATADVDETKPGVEKMIKVDAVPSKTAFTVSMWVKSDEAVAGTYLFADGCCQYFQFRSNGAGAFPAARMCMDDDYTWGGEADHWRTGKATQELNKWQMVTVTVSSVGKATVYVDGEEVSEYWTETGLTESGEGWFAYKNANDVYTNMFSDPNVNAEWKDSVTLGSGDWWSENFAGLMDEVYIYERELSAADVKALYDADAPSTTGNGGNSGSAGGNGGTGSTDTADMAPVVAVVALAAVAAVVVLKKRTVNE